MARGARRMADSFTFGGRVPAAIGGLLAAIGVASVLFWMPATNAIGSLFPFSPGLILSGQVWRLATWPLVQTQPLTLLFVALMIWQFGAQLAFEWGEGRFLARFVAISVIAGVVATLLAYAWPPADVPYTGAWPVALALLFAWGLMHAGAQLNWFGVLPMSGATVAKVILFGTIVVALFEGRGLAGLGAYALNLAAIAVAWAQVNSRGSLGRPWLRAQRRWTAWRQERRTRHLKVIRRNGEDERPRWMN